MPVLNEIVLSSNNVPLQKGRTRLVVILTPLGIENREVLWNFRVLGPELSMTTGTSEGCIWLSLLYISVFILAFNLLAYGLWVGGLNLFSIRRLLRCMLGFTIIFFIVILVLIGLCIFFWRISLGAHTVEVWVPGLQVASSPETLSTWAHALAYLQAWLAQFPPLPSLSLSNWTATGISAAGYFGIEVLFGGEVPLPAPAGGENPAPVPIGAEGPLPAGGIEGEGLPVVPFHNVVVNPKLFWHFPKWNMPVSVPAIVPVLWTPGSISVVLAHNILPLKALTMGLESWYSGNTSMWWYAHSRLGIKFHTGETTETLYQNWMFSHGLKPLHIEQAHKYMEEKIGPSLLPFVKGLTSLISVPAELKVKPSWMQNFMAARSEVLGLINSLAANEHLTLFQIAYIFDSQLVYQVGAAQVPLSLNEWVASTEVQMTGEYLLPSFSSFLGSLGTPEATFYQTGFYVGNKEIGPSEFKALSPVARALFLNMSGASPSRIPAIGGPTPKKGAPSWEEWQRFENISRAPYYLPTSNKGNALVGRFL